MNTVTIDNITFNSNFDSGNMASVEKKNYNKRTKTYEFTIHTQNDCEGTDYKNRNRSWWYFSVKNVAPGTSIKFNIRNMNCQKKLFSFGMKPVVRTGKTGNWERVKLDVNYEANPNDREYFKVSFKHQFMETKKETYFAMCYPFSYKDTKKMIEDIKTKLQTPTNNKRHAARRRKIYFHHECLTKSVEERDVDILTISSTTGISDQVEEPVEGCYPEEGSSRAAIFPEKPMYFLSARVHPGETPGTFIFNGFLKFILDEDDPRAALLRKHFVFKLLPILNPDGVYHGHYRTDRFGQNLNRFYTTCTSEKQPSIYAVTNLLRHYKEHQRLYMYMDLHAHATKRGCFIFGNALPKFEDQRENLLYPKLVAMNSQHVDFNAGNFHAKSMRSKDKRDGLSKEGTGRVGIYKHTNMVHCYTLEGNYITGKVVNHLGDLPPLKNGQKYSTQVERSTKQSPRYTIEIYEDVGKGLAAALLDMVFRDANPYSRIPNSNYGNLKGVAEWVEKIMSKKRKFWMGAKKGKRSSSDDEDEDDENSDDDGSETTTTTSTSSVLSSLGTPSTSSRSQPIGKPLIELKPSKPQLLVKEELLRMKDDSEDSSSEMTPTSTPSSDISTVDDSEETSSTLSKNDTAFDRLSKPRSKPKLPPKKKVTRRSKPLSQSAFNRLTAKRRDFSKLKTKYFNASNIKFDSQPIMEPAVSQKKTSSNGMNLGYEETYQVTTRLLGKPPLHRASSYTHQEPQEVIRQSFPARPMTSGINQAYFRHGKRSHAMMVVPPPNYASKHAPVQRRSVGSSDQRATSAKRVRRRRKRIVLAK